MTMVATPEVARHGAHAGRVDPSAIVPVRGDGGVIVHCVLTEPSSAAGRSVDVFFPASTIDDMLRAFRDQARDNRQRSGPQDDMASPLLSFETAGDALRRLIEEAERIAREGRNDG